jgi:hypothetical protein
VAFDVIESPTLDPGEVSVNRAVGCVRTHDYRAGDRRHRRRKNDFRQRAGKDERVERLSDPPRSTPLRRVDVGPS